MVGKAEAESAKTRVGSRLAANMVLNGKTGVDVRVMRVSVVVDRPAIVKWYVLFLCFVDCVWVVRLCSGAAVMCIIMS